MGSNGNQKDHGMIIIDAHSDFRYEYMGHKNNHACATRRSLEVLGEGKIFTLISLFILLVFIFIFDFYFFVIPSFEYNRFFVYGI